MILSKLRFFRRAKMIQTRLYLFKDRGDRVTELYLDLDLPFIPPPDMKLIVGNAHVLPGRVWWWHDKQRLHIETSEVWHGDYEDLVAGGWVDQFPRTEDDDG